MCAPQLPRRCLRDHSRLEHNHVAGPDVDLGNNLMGHLMLDAVDLAALHGCTPTVYKWRRDRAVLDAA